jgi:hypothetical protein
MLDLIKLLPVVIAAILIGRWFHAEVRKAKAAHAPWYRPYLSAPGIVIVLAALGLPLLAWIAGQ